MHLAPASTGRRGGSGRPRTVISTGERPRRRRTASRRPPQRRPPARPDPAKFIHNPWFSVDAVARAEGVLIAQWQRAHRRSDPAAPELAALLLGANASLLKRTARHRARRLDPDDIAQAAQVGLLTALQRFQPERGAPFGPYAIHWIRKELQRTVAAGDYPIAIPAHRVGDLAAIRRTNQTNSEQTNAQVATDLDVSTETARGLRGVLSVMPADRAPEPIEDTSATDRLEWQVAITRALAKLPSRTARAVRLRYGLDDGHPRTLRQVAAQLGVSDYTVRSDLTRAHEQLARQLK